MWSLLQRSLENLLIGAAASLIMLALLSRAQTLPAGDTISAGRDDLSRTPRNTQDYAARWRQIANEFYAAHPLRDAAPSKVPALTVSQKVRGQSRLGQVSAATHRMPPAKSARGAASLASPLAAQPSP